MTCERHVQFKEKVCPYSTDINSSSFLLFIFLILPY